MAPVLRARRSYNGQRSLTRCLVGNDGCIELFGNHAGRFIGRNQPQIAASDPQQSNALGNRHMDLAGSVDLQANPVSLAADFTSRAIALSPLS